MTLKHNIMKKRFKDQLRHLIMEHGYWSTEVYDFNNLWQGKIGYALWLKWSNEVTAEN